MDFALQCVKLSFRTMLAIAKLDNACKGLEIPLPDVRGKLAVVKQDLTSAIADVDKMIEHLS